MRRFRPASPEFKEALELICPNEYGLDTPSWLKIAARMVGMDYGRLTRLWRDNRAKIHRYEEGWIEEKLIEKTLRTQTELEKKLAYQTHITGETLNGNLQPTSSLHSTGLSGRCAG